MSLKDDLLEGLNEAELLQLARSVSKTSVDEDTSKRVLIKLVKGSLSAEQIKQRVNQTRSPRSVKRWNMNALFLGGVAQVFLIAWGFSGILISIAYPNTSYEVFYVGVAFQTLSILSIIGTALLLVFAVLHMGSMVAIRRRVDGDRMGVVSASAALVASIVGVLYYVLTYLGLTLDIHYNPDGSVSSTSINALGAGVPVAYNLLLTVTMILVGVFFLVCRESFSNAELWMVTGLLYVLAGAFQLGYTSPYYFMYVYLASSAMFIVVGVMGAICFFTGKYAKRSKRAHV